jgi:hypothetical protein
LNSKDRVRVDCVDVTGPASISPSYILTMTRIILAYILFIALVQSTEAFAVHRPAFLLGVTPTALQGPSLGCPSSLFASEGDETAEAASEEGGEGTLQDDVPPINSSIVPPPSLPNPKRLDPLIASLTRDDSASSNAETTNVPLLGEVPLDGSLLVLVPALVIGVLGFVMAIYIALNAQDSFVDQLNDLSQDFNDLAVSKTNVAAPTDGACRGLCSSQEADLNSLRTYMEGLSRK